MDLFSWITGSDPVDNSLTVRSSLNSSSHSGVYRRPGNQTAAKDRKPCNPGIYSAYPRGNGKARSGCLAGMRGFEPVEEQVHTQRSVRGARSLSPQKVHRDHFLLRDTDQHRPVHTSPMRSREFRPATIGAQQSGLYGRPSEAQRSFFNEVGGHQHPYQQAQASQIEVYDMPPKRLHQFQPSLMYYEESPQGPVECAKNVSSPSTPATNVSTSPPKSDSSITPSTSDHSDVDDLAPRSIHSPTISDSHTPPSSVPGSPAVSQTLPDAASGADCVENPQKDGEDSALPLKKLPFASLDLKDSGIVKARTCVRNAQKLNKSLTGECRSLEDEMSDLTKDLEALREQLKNRRV